MKWKLAIFFLFLLLIMSPFVVGFDTEGLILCAGDDEFKLYCDVGTDVESTVFGYYEDIKRKYVITPEEQKEKRVRNGILIFCGVLLFITILTYIFSPYLTKRKSKKTSFKKRINYGKY